ncbi:MAG: indole-3-glycerol phosphate synthase [Mariniblastus sp.]
MSSILDKIVHHKIGEIEAAKQRTPIATLKSKLADCPPPLDFYAALTGGEEVNRVSLIAEVKKASPSKGVIREDFDPVSIAQAYAAAGANCISVLTDEHFFQGKLEYLKSIRAAVTKPLLRKDFILDEYQIYEARAAGADAVLLIAECLDPERMKCLHQLITELGMTALVELYDAANVAAVLACEPKLVGVNNRDLNTFEIDLMHSIQVKQSLPAGIAMVSESGIFTAADVQLMKDNNVDAILVGESLMRSDDIEAAVVDLVGSQV